MPIFIFVLLASSLSGHADWPTWRGLTGGSARIGSYAATWTPDSQLDWKAKLPGRGCSTRIVTGERIIFTCPVDAKDAVLCFGWWGKQTWLTHFGAKCKGKHRNGSNPSTITDGKGYATREAGVIFLASADANFAILSENTMSERMIASRVPLRDHILLRGEEQLFCAAPVK
jgi:hypothetical protein